MFMGDQLEKIRDRLQLAPSCTRVMFLAIPKAAIGTLRSGQFIQATR
jgi:hypothetical protein